MSRNSTLNFWELFLKHKDVNFYLPFREIDLKDQLNPRQQTIEKVLAYAGSTKGIKMKSGEKILISLN
tara:strand:- start:199 stop:402 length:204 start_codon:yes stop_codon:yes gene_type:complete